MKIYFTIICCLLFGAVIEAQIGGIKDIKTIELKNGETAQILTQQIYCHGSGEDQKNHTPSESFKVLAKGNTMNANFLVTYIGFTPDHRSAVQFAIDILSTYIKSDVTIHVRAEFKDLGPDGTLAGASFTQINANLNNANLPRDIWFPTPLAEKLAGEELTDFSIPDIEISVNNNAGTNWYTDTNNPGGIGQGQADLATIIIHEVMHGLGFSGFVGVNNGVGSYLIPDNGNMFPFIFDAFIEDFNGDRMLEETTNNSIMLGNFVTSGSVFFGGNTFPGAIRPQLYTPAPWDLGSSLYHLDNSVYGASSPNRMMVPFYNNMDVNNNPGIAMSALYDLGWDFTDIQHPIPPAYIEDPTQDFAVEVAIISDFGIDTNSLELVYSQDTFETTSIAQMSYDAIRDTFVGLLPANGAGVTYQYYFRVNNSRGVEVKAPNRDFSPLFYAVSIGDGRGPEITHTPIEQLTTFDSEIYIRASAFDAQAGTDSLFALFTFNGEPEVEVKMNRKQDGFGVFYDITYDLGRNLEEADVLEYRIRAIDKAPTKNEEFLPSAGKYIVSVLNIPLALEFYDTDFEGDDGSDFIGNGWTIEKPTTLSDSVMTNKAHPYMAAGQDMTTNFIQQLISPIVVGATNDFIKFDEIVLVEPGESGVAFPGTNFYDYVVVETKKVTSSIWVPLGEGYDSREQPVWQARYESVVSNNNSFGAPTESHFRERQYSFGVDGGYSSGDTIQIRFRLFSDPFAAGWGWAIDNLNIQNPTSTVAVEDFIEEDNQFLVYPNPSNTGMITIAARFTQAANNLRTELTDIYGRLIRSERITNGSQFYKQEIDISDLPAGIYFMTLRDNESAITKKVVKY